MATITQRKNGSWHAIIRRSGFPKQYRTFAKKSDAEAWAVEIEREIRLGSHISRQVAEKTTFDGLAKSFEEEFAPHHYRGKAWKFKLAALKNRLGDYSLIAITAPVVAKFRDERLKDPDPRYKNDPANAPRISPATVKSEIDLLSKILDVAQKEFGIHLPAGNPVLGVRKPKTSKARDRRLSPEEWVKLEDECRKSQNPWLHPALILAVETAMRQGELLSLEWKNIDKKRCLALLLDPEKIKTEDPRAVPLTSVALTALEGLPISIKGRILSTDRMTLYKAFERACHRAEITNFTWHDLRHEALSRLAERGDLTVLEMAAVSGHKTLQMLKRYTHLQAETLAKKLG